MQNNMDYGDVYDTLLQNGMFRNRESQDLSRPISGSNADTPDWYDGELEDYQRALQEWYNHDILETIREAFPDY